MYPKSRLPTSKQNGAGCGRLRGWPIVVIRHHIHYLLQYTKRFALMWCSNADFSHSESIYQKRRGNQFEEINLDKCFRILYTLAELWIYQTCITSVIHCSSWYRTDFLWCVHTKTDWFKGMGKFFTSLLKKNNRGPSHVSCFIKFLKSI